MGTDGAVMQMISYGIVSGAMLLRTGMLYDRTGSASIDGYGGVAATMPRFAAFTMLFSMANVGMPGTSGFVGEFLVLMGAMKRPFFISTSTTQLPRSHLLGSCFDTAFFEMPR
ncbi:hypothetical protein PI93_019615 [Pandoraea fibrosis]|uniref:NADH:quinone oxidoreductase/Mrp antiporter transmembrane domain-containing protein n=1 Tax=Pandoraea fibrosis TaxID=1891094 RepID=A0ABX6I0S6_9BURK|nr:hypothetical protein PJ20_008385 [Pandoraea fibrosis]QHF15885.1 hypothetical protein PI93_019615 [Pandoraea fibrosis]